MSDALWMNAVSGAPEYTAAELRRADAAVLFPGVADSTGARGGVRPGHTPASLSSTTWTVHDIVGVIYPGLTATSGPYRFQHAEESGSVDPADGSLDRTDGLDLQIRDDDEDASGFRDSTVVYVAGTPGGGAPAVTANSIRLATMFVPAGGSPAPTMTVVAPWTVSAGGILPVRDVSELPTGGLYDGMPAWDQDRELFVVRSAGWPAVGWARHGRVDWRNTNQSITSGTNTTVIWDQTTEDFGGLGRTSGVYEVMRPGLWRPTVQVRWDGNISGTRRRLILQRNNVDIASDEREPLPGGATDLFQQVVARKIDCAEGDTFRVRVFQDSGGSLDLVGGEDNLWIDFEFLGAT